MATVAAVAAAVAGGGRRIAHMKETAMKLMETNIDQASVRIRTGEIDNPKVYCNTCMKLGSAIDLAIAVNAFPSSSHLPRLLLIVREFCRRKSELQLPSLMLLMLTIKAACQIGWFPDGDKDGLLMMAKEVSYGLSDTDRMNIEPSNAHSRVLDIVLRFYPTMKIQHILTSFDVKAGYGIFVADFHISMGTTPRRCQNLWLLVGQLDNMDTAACITSPLNVDFLINGNKVPNRTKDDMGEGPQLPSNITKMIKYGLNILQVFGEFNGHYIIALAFMNPISSPDPSQLQDYLRTPMSGGVNSDCDVSEMSSQISLYCPVSHHRIKTPVKGHLCKHSQCFDYDYFMEVNSIKPTWKCPLCDNPVCNQDIRVDQDFLKILNEAAKDVDYVSISEDGSWMAAETNRDTRMHATAVSTGQTQVNVCKTNQAQSTIACTPSPISLGQTQVDICKTTQANSTTMFVPPTDSPGQIQVNYCTTNQPQCTTILPSPATVTKHAASPGQTQVNLCTTKQDQSPTMSTSPGQTQVNGCTTNQTQSTTMLTPPATLTKPAACPGQTQVNICTTKQAQSPTVFTPHAGSSGQTQVNVCTTNQAQSTTMFTPPAAVAKPAVSPSQSQVNICVTPLAKSTTVFYRSPHSFALAYSELGKGSKQGSYTTPGESQPDSNISRLLPTQHQEASGDAMPSGRMRGSLRGDQLQAARLQYLAPPRQPARANEPWLRPPIPSLPLPFLMPQTPANSENPGNLK
ncbi:hypothetical protein R6Q59_016915 [Mikania micrantha]